MKKRTHNKLLKICVAEILLQVGFQKTNNYVIDIFTDILVHTLESICKDLVDCSDRDVLLNYICTKYKDDELLKFLEVNMFEGENILQNMKILPKNFDWRGKNGGLKISGLVGEEEQEEEEKNSFSDAELDFFVESIKSKTKKHEKKHEEYHMNHTMNDFQPKNIDSTQENHLNDDFSLLEIFYNKKEVSPIIFPYYVKNNNIIESKLKQFENFNTGSTNFFDDFYYTLGVEPSKIYKKILPKTKEKENT